MLIRRRRRRRVSHRRKMTMMMMMIRCRSVFSASLSLSLALFHSLFSRGIRTASSIYRASSRKRKRRQVIDRFLFFLSLSCAVDIGRCSLTATGKSRAILFFLLFSLSLLFVQNCTIRSVLGQSSSKTNHEFVSISLSLLSLFSASRDTQTFLRLRSRPPTDQKRRTRKGSGDEREAD